MNHYLSPFILVTKQENKITYRHIINKDGITLPVDAPLLPNEDTIEANLFWNSDSKKHEYDLVFNHFESSFKQSMPTVGYIETTSRCPFLCIMCPKSSNKLIRKTAQMSDELFYSLASQLRHQKTVTLHLFGDPLMDAKIYDRLRILNKLGLTASFSTNVPMFSNDRVLDLLNYNIDSIVVSVDSLNPNTYSQIRKSPSNRTLDHGQFLDKLERFLDATETKGDKLGKIILRVVNMNINEETRDQLGQYAERYSKVEIDIKNYINFPNTNRPELGNPAFFSDNTPVFLYQLFGNEMPFKCLKPWKSCELAVQSDGEVVPCCLCYNAPFSLGNINTESIESLYFSNRYEEYRRAIFYNETSKDWICNSCYLNQERYYLLGLQRDHFDYLRCYAGVPITTQEYQHAAAL